MGTGGQPSATTLSDIVVGNAFRNSCFRFEWKHPMSLKQYISELPLAINKL